VSVTFAQIEPSTRCNFTCGFCAGRAMAQQDLPDERFLAFLDAHPDLRHVELQGEGEPLLHPRFFDMAEECRRRGIRVSLITNGSLLSPERVERLLDTGLGSIHVSIESADPAQFQSIRGGSFAKVRAGLALLTERKRERQLAEPLVGLAVTVLRSTLPRLDAVARLYGELRLDGGIVAQPLQRMAAYRQNYDPAMVAEMLDGVDLARFSAARQDLGQSLPVPRPNAFFYFALFDGFDPVRDACPWLARGAYLNASGTLSPCCFIKDLASARSDAGEAAALRSAMAAAFAPGRLPKSCAGCGTAHLIATHARRAAEPR
jgi:MoaA/NifB/PqqE/SkfB family radical SAM enzyme